MLGGDRLGERARQRRGVDQLDPVAHPALPEVGVGEERELQRRDRALDRHVDDVHDQPAAVELGQRLGQGDRTVVGVEVEDALPPLPAVEHAGRLVRPRLDAGGDDQVVVRQPGPVGQQHLVVVGGDPVDLAVDQVHPVRDEPLPSA